MAIEATLSTRVRRPAGWARRAERLVSKPRYPIAYGGLVAFSFLYFYRPEDFIKPLGYIPLAKIAAIIAVIPVLGSLMGGASKMPKAIKYLWLLFFHMAICVPLALWMGGAYTAVFDKLLKGVIIAMVISVAVVALPELRKLLWIQVSAVALVTFASIAVHHYDPQSGRLSGVQEGILSNPNDLAINIAISFPLAVAFMLLARSLKKWLWMAALVVMCVGVVLTGSRSGLMALLVSILLCVWEYGIRGKRRKVVISTIIALFLGLGIALLKPSYRTRVESIFSSNVGGPENQGSIEARKELLKKSIVTALTHPVFGIGPGCFPLVDESWHVAHNSFTELAAEAGIPALVFFLLAFGAGFANIARVRKTASYRENEECRILSQAMWAGLVAYLAGSVFASTEYTLYPYFAVGYTCALARIVGVAFSAPHKKDPKLRLSAPLTRLQNRSALPFGGCSSRICSAIRMGV
jgi:O-antigen ligase